MRNFTILFLILLSLSSCDKSINGKVTDNFGEPIENVEIKIPNSGFTTKTKNDGSFNLDYVAGEFEIVFNKDGYIPFDKSLKIAEQQKYPLGDMEMIKLPKDKGFYFIGNDKYIEVPKLKLPSTKKTGSAFMVGKYTNYTYYFPKDTLGLNLAVDTLGTLRFFDNNPNSAYLTKADESRFMLNYSKGGMSYSGGGSTKGRFVDTKAERIAKGIRIIEFKPSDSIGNYSFVEISTNKYGGESMSGYGFCFTVQNEDNL